MKGPPTLSQRGQIPMVRGEVHREAAVQVVDSDHMAH